MKIVYPSRLRFWQLILTVSTALPFLSIWQMFALANTLGIDIPSRPAWMGLIAGLALMGILPLLFLTLTWSHYEERILLFMEFPERVSQKMQWFGISLLIISIIGYTIVFMHPFVRNLWGGEGWIRFLIYWFFTITGIFSLKSIRSDIHWFTALLVVTLCQSIFHLFIVNLSQITDYPFAMGWSETSRYYYPSLFLSKEVYGQQFSWPVLHPTLHILLAPPYLFHAPLWVHRLWQVAIRFVLLGAIVPVLMKRLSIQEKAVGWLIASWMLLFLFMGPVYFHLAVPIIILLIGFSNQSDRRTWIAVIAASIWCGWSRVNWYPVPGMIAAILYFIEVPIRGKNIWRYLLKPALWFITGILIAFLFQRIYIGLSGVDSEYFYTSLSSSLLWYRLLPNASYFLGILPGALLASLPMWLAIYIFLRSHKEDIHPIRLSFIFAALFVLFLGGIVVSLKIGGGADLHNMDAYFVLLLIVVTHLMFACYQREDGETGQPISLHWVIVILIMIMPAWSQLKFSPVFITYERDRTQTVEVALQSYVNEVNAQGGEILFITQRHLVSMDMLKNVRLVPEYEREDLMEAAMGNNAQYLQQFRSDMESQRFKLIVVDPLNFNIMTSNRSFAEENNVWVRKIMKQILCNYREEAVFPQDDIALYVPQTGTRQCP